MRSYFSKISEFLEYNVGYSILGAMVAAKVVMKFEESWEPLRFEAMTPPWGSQLPDPCEDPYDISTNIVAEVEKELRDVVDI